ncbi:MAG: ribosomal protein S18-alanine N-acetyltransferase [Gammaproteobacteria bacterium]|nr:ribosomal protein S18-alanine N-acetyltransferase [Gammaproteobacteria bacterium]
MTELSASVDAALDNEGLSVRPMRLGDLPAVRAIECAVYEFPWSRHIFEDCLRSGYSCVMLVASRRAIGYGVMTINGEECHILNLCIEPASQRRGYAHLLLQHLIAKGSAQRANTAFLEVRMSNNVAQHIYAKAGFNEVGKRPAYYPAVGGREDALILAKSLSGAADGPRFSGATNWD